MQGYGKEPFKPIIYYLDQSSHRLNARRRPETSRNAPVKRYPVLSSLRPPSPFLLGPISADAWLSRRHRLPSLLFYSTFLSFSLSRRLLPFRLIHCSAWLGVENGGFERGGTDLPASGRAYGFWVRFLRMVP